MSTRLWTVYLVFSVFSMASVSDINRLFTNFSYRDLRLTDTPEEFLSGKGMTPLGDGLLEDLLSIDITFKDTGDTFEWQVHRSLDFVLGGLDIFAEGIEDSLDWSEHLDHVLDLYDYDRWVWELSDRGYDVGDGTVFLELSPVFRDSGKSVYPSGLSDAVKEEISSLIISLYYEELEE